jgi:hypothetical protein
VVSLILHRTLDVTVDNQYSDIELISPVYFCNCGTYYEYPVERTDVGVIMKTGFRFGLGKLSGGILMYEIRRKGNIRSNHQSDIDTMHAKVIEDASKMIRFLVIWKIECYKEPKVNVILVENDSELVLNEDKLAQLCDKVNNIPSSYYSSTWLTYDTMFVIRHVVMQKEGIELEITISKEPLSLSIMRPMWIESER